MVYPTGGRVGIDLPAGFEPDAASPRFRNPANGAIVTVLDLPPDAYEEIERGLFAANEPNVTIVGRESFPFASGLGFLTRVRIRANNEALQKWLLLARSVGGDLTALVTLEMPEAAEKTYPDAVIRAAFGSVSFRATPVREQLDLLPFKMSELAGFRVVRAMPGAGAMLTDGPLDQSQDQPTILVTTGPPAPAQRDQAALARDMMESFGLPNFRVTDVQRLRLGGQTTYEVRGTAKDNNLDLTAVQWVRFGDGGFLRIVGLAPTSKWQDAFTRFRAVRDGIGPR
jgi:hypothetical protein